MATGRPNGRPPKPSQNRHGNGGDKIRVPANPKIVDETFAGLEEIPPAPNFGSAGLRMWNSIWVAGRKWLSREADFHVVELLCYAYDEAEVCRELLATGQVDRFYELPNGSFVSHPVVIQLKDLRVQITAWLAALGFSPADRARLGIGEVKQVDALDDLKARRAERRA